MSPLGLLRFGLVVTVAVLAFSEGKVLTQADVVDPASRNLPNPYQPIRNRGCYPKGGCGVVGQR